MGFAPAPATRKVLAKTGLGAFCVMDTIELNEAFAAQALAVTRDLGLPDDAACTSTSTAAPSRSDIHAWRERRAACLLQPPFIS